MENCFWSHESLLIPEVKIPHLWVKFCLGDMEANYVIQHEIKHGATWSPLEVTFCISSAVFCFPHSISPENPHHLVLWVANMECAFRESDGKESHYRISSVQCTSFQSLSLCDPMNLSMPGLPVHHHLRKFTQTHVHRVHDAIQSSHPRLSPSPPVPNPSQHQSLFQWVNSLHEVAKVLELQL